MNENSIIPPIRDNIQFKEIPREEGDLVIIFDPDNIAEKPITLPMELLPILRALTGDVTIKDFRAALEEQAGGKVDITPLLNLIMNLDFLGYLDSPSFKQRKEEVLKYRASPTRPPICAGITYSDDPAQLADELDNIRAAYVGEPADKNAVAVIAPHIDFQVGKISHETYSAAYKAISESDADLFVVLGTAHHANSDFFMFTRKNYQTPLGEIETDVSIVDALEKAFPDDITIDDAAHRTEHSVELQAALLQSAFKDRKIKILPILTGSIEAFFYGGEGAHPKRDKRLKLLFDAIRNEIEREGRKAVYIASVDFAHVGRRFEDAFDADSILDELRNEDMELIHTLEKCDSESFYDKIAAVENQRKICGFSPIYFLLKLARPERGEFLVYNQWNDKATESAVTFASMAFYK